MMKSYLVGGAVRDHLLGDPVQDRDWVVVGAHPEDLLEQGFEPVGQAFPVFLHPRTQEEYALARTERKQGLGYHGFELDYSPDVSLEADLGRRDLTVNAMAMDADGALHDPYGGYADLRQGWLRHVSPAFAEDPLRILRVARFAARYARRGFRVHPDTLALMSRMATPEELEALTAERVWKELERALGEPSPAVFFRVLQQCGAYALLLPELEALLPTNWTPASGEPEPVALRALNAAAALSDDAALRFAAFVQPLAYAPQAQSHPGEVGEGADATARALALVQTLAQRLRVPNQFLALAELGLRHWRLAADAAEREGEALVAALQGLDAFRRGERFQAFLGVCRAGASAAPVELGLAARHLDFLERSWASAREVSAKPFVDQGLKGPAVGEAMRARQAQLIDQLRTSDLDRDND